MLRCFRLALAVVFGLALSVAAAGLFVSKEESVLAALYETFFGSPDLGPVDFETIRRSATANDALACPPGFCGGAAVDFDPGVFQVSDEELRRRFAEFVLAQPRVAPLYRSEAPGRPMQDRYLQRTKLMSFPDTINVRFIALDNDRSTLAIYSRSQLGRRDFGVNLERIRLWTNGAMARGTGG